MKTSAHPPTTLPCVISIDPQGSMDLDDALDAVPRGDGGWTVDVCLPDVPSDVAPETPIDTEAAARGFTRYAGRGVRQAMLPGAVTERLTLAPRGRRPMVWIRIGLGADLAVDGVDVSRIAHRTETRMTYGEADDALAWTSHPFHAQIADLWALARLLHARRRAGTGAVFDADAGVFTNEEGAPVALPAGRAHRSHLIVMELMILTNATLADHARRRGMPILYRNHRPMDASSGFRAQIAAELAAMHGMGTEESCRAMRSLQSRIGPASLGSTCEGHWGLDVPAYAWFTSPLRRYGDILNLRALLDGIVHPNLEGEAVRLNALDMEERTERSDFHAERMRRSTAAAVRRCDAAEIQATALHRLLRACAQHHGPSDMLDAETMRRIGGASLSGRDMHAVLQYGPAALGAETFRAAVDWTCDHPGRLLRLVQDAADRGVADPIRVRSDGRPAVLAALVAIADGFGIALDPVLREAALVEASGATSGPTTVDAAPLKDLARENAKGELLELAASVRGAATFEKIMRCGPPHNPLYTVEALFTRPDGSIERRRATASTIKAAEAAAAGLVLDAVAGEGRPTTRTATPACGSINPKSALLERAARRNGMVEFGPVVRNGPDHDLRFGVTATYRGPDGTWSSDGTDSTLKGAEREACAGVLRAIAETPE